MLDDNFDQIQSNLDMQLLTQMQIERDLQDMRGGPTPEEIKANKEARHFLGGIFIVGIVSFLVFLWLMGFLPDAH